MDEFRQKISINAQLIVKECVRLSKSIMQIRFQLESNDKIAVGRLGLGPHLKLLFPKAAQQQIQFPDLNETGKIIWPEGQKPVIRNYSLRAYNPLSQILTIEFVIHDEGIGSCWAKNAKSGDMIGLIGIGAKCQYQQEYLVLVGDITAKSAISYILENLPAHTKGHAFIEVLDHSDIVTINQPEGMQLTWQVRQEESLLPSLIKDLLRLPDMHNVLIWGGMERALAQQVRQSLVDHFNLNKSTIQLTNYWCIGSAEGEFRRREA